MSRWFRHYAGMMRDEKLVAAAVRTKQPVERVVWLWGAILESAAEINDNGKFSLDTAEAAYFLRADQADLDSILVALQELGRLAENCVVKWGDRQFSSDRSADRTRAYRDRHKEGQVAEDHNVTQGVGDGVVTSQPSHGDAPETETELDTEKKDIRAVAKATRPRATRFDEFWSAYPRRKGANPRAEAEEIYNRHVRDGVPEQEMIDGAKAFARQEAANNGTPYIEQAVKFLRRKHWVGSQDPPVPVAINDGKVFVKCESEQWFAWQAYLKRTTGKGSPRNPHADGWRFDSEWPPGHQSAAA